MSTALRAEPSPTISTINLVISIVSFLTTIPTLLPRPIPRRIILCFRFLHTLLLLSPIGLSLLTLAKTLNDPLQTLSTGSANDHIRQILDITAREFNATPGFTRFVITPGSGDVESSVVPHVAIAFMTVVAGLGVVFQRVRVRRQASLLAFGMSTAYVLGGLLAAFQPGKLDRDSSILEESWLDERFKELGGVNETRFLRNVWLEPILDDDMSDSRVRNATNVLDIKGFHDSFCEAFNDLPIQAGLVVDLVDQDGIPITSPPSTSGTTSASSASTTSTVTVEDEEEEPQEEEEEDSEEEDAEEDDPPIPGSEDDRPQALRQAIPPVRQSSDEIQITPNLLSQLLIVYTIGKPLFTTYGKSISLLSLPFLTLSPVFVAYATRSSVLYPFILGWLCLLLLMIVYATPETLRWVGVGFKSSDLMTFCGRRYQVFVTDDVSFRLGVFDMVSFGLIVLTGILQGFRWMRVREHVEEEGEGEVKMMGYDEVYSENGALRW